MLDQTTRVTRDTSERRQIVTALVRERGSVQVAPLAARFGVSLQTIRKDLHFLARRGVVDRSYGGAILVGAPDVIVEPSVESKRAINLSEKVRIGALAASMVRPGESIVLDSGTTTLEIARHLTDHEDITVLTNDLEILNVLAKKTNLNVVMLGGALRRRNMALYGAQTVAAFDNLRVDKLFLGVDGLDLKYGITTHYEPEAMLNRKMVDAAQQVIAVSDQSKFGRVCLHKIVGLDQIHDLVINDPCPQDLVAVGERMNFNIHLA